MVPIATQHLRVESPMIHERCTAAAHRPTGDGLKCRGQISHVCDDQCYFNFSIYYLSIIAKEVSIRPVIWSKNHHTLK